MKVLTTEWIFGERLENASGDARQPLATQLRFTYRRGHVSLRLSADRRKLTECEEAAQYLPKGCSRKMPLHFLHFNGDVCSNNLFSNTSALTNSVLFRANSTCKGS